MSQLAFRKGQVVLNGRGLGAVMIVLNQDVLCLGVIKARGIFTEGLVILYGYLRHGSALRHDYRSRASSENDKVCIMHPPFLL